MSKYTITVEYGPANSHRWVVDEGTTFRDVIADPNLRAFTRHGDNVVAKVGGVEQNLDCAVRNGDRVVLETRAHSKA